MVCVNLSRMENSLNIDLREYVSLNVRCIKLIGYFYLKHDSLKKQCLHTLYITIVTGFFYVLCMASQIANMVVAFGDIEKMTEASFLLLTNTVQALKIYCFMFNGSKVLKLVESINREEFQPRNWRQYNILQNDIRISKKITKIFLFMCCVTCSLWGIFPFLDKGPQESLRLPLSGWYPFSVEKSPRFELVYVYQITATLANGLGNISMDTFLSGVIMVISGQLSILNNSLQIMKGNLEKRGAPIPSIVTNVKHYRNIIEFTDDMISIFTVCIGSQFVVSVIIICMTMFQMSLVPAFSLQFISMSLYQACILLEIFLWCYYGNDVILKSEKLTESAYRSEWIDSSKDFRKNLLFFMTRSQNSLKLYAGGYFTLSLETFMAIMKSSWSYYAVLNRVHSEKNYSNTESKDS